MEAIGIVGAFWSAIRRTSDKIQQAGAGWLGTYHSALRIRSAGIRRAWVARIFPRGLRNVDPRALNQRIASVTVRAGADGVVVHGEALGIHPAGAWARVSALVLDASLVLGTL